MIAAKFCRVPQILLSAHVMVIPAELKLSPSLPLSVSLSLPLIIAFMDVFNRSD
jgi:uncharacterized membrane protein YGL010W